MNCYVVTILLVLTPGFLLSNPKDGFPSDFTSSSFQMPDVLLSHFKTINPSFREADLYRASSSSYDRTSIPSDRVPEMPESSSESSSGSSSGGVFSDWRTYGVLGSLGLGGYGAYYGHQANARAKKAEARAQTVYKTAKESLAEAKRAAFDAEMARRECRYGDEPIATTLEKFIELLSRIIIRNVRLKDIVNGEYFSVTGSKIRVGRVILLNSNEVEDFVDLFNFAYEQNQSLKLRSSVIRSVEKQRLSSLRVKDLVGLYDFINGQNIELREIIEMIQNGESKESIVRAMEPLSAIEFVVEDLSGIQVVESTWSDYCTIQ